MRIFLNNSNGRVIDLHPATAEYYIQTGRGQPIETAAMTQPETATLPRPKKRRVRRKKAKS